MAKSIGLTKNSLKGSSTMVKYMMAVSAARFFSLSPQTLRLYRRLGNVLLERQRMQSGLPERYVERARLLFELCKKYPAIRDGSKVLEVGTGWMHWEGMIIRLFYDAQLTLFDVWDNRLWNTFKQYFDQLAKIVDTELDMSPAQRKRVHEVLSTLLAANSFDEVYSAVGATYVLDPSGTLKQFKDESFDAIVSCDVLEHVTRDILPDVIQDFYRVLRPGGYAIHQIDIADHFAYFVPSISRKNYYKYSDATWARYFENKVQYFNRVQRPEWFDLFRKAGFEVVEEHELSESIGAIRVDGTYQNLSRADLECMTIRVVHRKPQ
jgi:SAM-dependent methyltransferase